MQRTPARVLAPAQLRRLLGHTRRYRYPARNRAMILLSFKAGLRAGEIAGLDWSMVLNAGHVVGSHLTVTAGIAKYGSARHIPINPDLKHALMALHTRDGCPLTGPVIRSERGARMTPRSVVNWFGQAYGKLGLLGCSSHSGRRTFITRAARLVARSGGSLRDVQELAGHRAITTTERYIQGDRDAQRKLVRLI